MPQKFDHPCGTCDNDNCNNGHAFDQKCPKLIEHEKRVIQYNIENTRREFAQINSDVIMGKRGYEYVKKPDYQL